MSTPEPAEKQTRQDGAKAAVVAPPARPAPSPMVAPSPTAATATAQAGTAAASRMVAAGEANHESRWKQAWHGAVDGAEIMAQLELAVGFSLLTGTYHGTIDLGKALYYLQLIAPHSALSAITLHGASRGTNPVTLTMNVWHKTYGLSAAHLSIAGFHLGSATGAACDLYGLDFKGHAADAGVVSFSRAVMHDVTFTKNGQTARAREVEMSGLTVAATSGSSLEGALHFAEAHVLDIVYPGASPVSFNLPSGANLDGVWTSTAKPAAAAPTATTAPTTAPAAGLARTAAPAPTTAAAPSLDVLPAGSHVNVTIDGIGAEVHAGGTNEAFATVRAIVVSLDDKDKKSLASISIAGFHAGGSAGAAGASIDRLTLAGAPGLVDALLSNRGVSANANVQEALALVKSIGLKPSVSGALSFTNIGVKHGPAGDTATGNFSANLTLPGTGRLAVTMTKFALATNAGGSGSFEHFDTTLVDESGKELAHVDLEGAAAAAASATTKTGSVHKFHARGDVAGLIKAGETLIHQLPPQVRAGLQMIRSLGISGDIAGSVAATATANGVSISGNFAAHIDAGTAGKIVVDVEGFRGSEGSAIDATFKTFKTTLTTAKGHQAASIHISNGSFGESAAAVAGDPKGRTAFRAGAVTATGSGPNVLAMVNGVVAHSASLTPPVRAAFNLVRGYYVNGSGSLDLSGVAIADQNGAENVALHNAHASFKLATGENVDARVSGFSGERKESGATGMTFESFVAELTAANGGGHAKIVVDKGGANIAAAPAKGPGDFSVTSHHASFVGEAHDIAKLAAGIRAHLGSLPPPIAQAFDVVGRYATSQTGASTGVDVAVTGDNLTLKEKGGKETATGDVMARVAVDAGIVNVALHGFAAQGTDVRFTGLDLSVIDTGGATAASLRVGGAHLAANGAADVASITASGDGARLKRVVDALGNRVPAQVSQALAAVGSSRVDAAISSISVAPTADGGLVTNAAVVKVSGAVSVRAGADTYRSPNAQISLYGAHVVLGADKKPREIDATSMDVSGAFAGVAGGKAIDGNATLHVGASKITLDAAGKVHSVDTQGVVLGGSLDSKALPAAPATAAATSTATAPTTSTATAPRAATTTPAAAATSTTPQTPMAVQAASAIKSADIATQTPILSGRYGSGMVHVNVPSGAMINVAVQVRDYALTSGTGVHIRPKLESFFIKVDGVELETSGTQGALELRLDHFFDFNITKYVVGQKKMSLDLGALTSQIMSRMSQTVAQKAGSAAAPAPAPVQTSAPTTANRAAAPAKPSELQKKHDKWEHGRNPKAAEEPRSMDVKDLFNVGVQLQQTSGSADVEIASRDGAIDAHLHGSAAGNGAGGGTMQLVANDVNARIGGQTVNATGIDTGPVAVTSTASATSVKLDHFSIATLHWLSQ